MSRTVTVKTRRGVFEVSPQAAREVAAVAARPRLRLPTSWWLDAVQERMSEWIKRDRGE